ncbi:MAG: extracellular solute-binding protein [Herbiconiux sp.]|uniref:extracellular solute-binding protein n=1 Tax=Herbiconiux sp. TaxID=1871186 RepID=UPI0011FEAC13|nr:extracellular solute-binding protein [Herbiconiux sp.]TAJ46908.1 MAG: extracellular solute-binding protein [Herbiconiux sp.]
MKQRRYLLPGIALACGLALAITGCSGNGGNRANASDFDPEVFPDSTYGDLSGDIILHDGSGGATLDAYTDTFLKRFQERTGVNTKTEFNGDQSKFFAAAESGNVPWSAIAFPTVADFVKARDGGYLQKIDTSKVHTDELEDGTYDDYGFYTQRYTANIAYNTDSFPDGKGPQNAKDFFDTEKFPGKRCLYDYPQLASTLELPLIADGVSHDDLYPLDLDRAFKKLDTIKDDIVWYSDGDSAIRYLTSGECDMGTIWSGRGFNAVVKDDAPIEMVWDDAQIADAVLAVPKDAPSPEAGQALLAMNIDDKESYANFVNKITYTTQFTDPAALDGVDEDVKPWLATKENTANGYNLDSQWYAENLDDILSKFNAYLQS